MLTNTYKPVGERHGQVFLQGSHRNTSDPLIPTQRRGRGRPSFWVAVYYQNPLPIPQDGRTVYFMSRHRSFLSAEAALVRWMHGGRKGNGFKTIRRSRLYEDKAIYCTPSGRALVSRDADGPSDTEAVPTPSSIPPAPEVVQGHSYAVVSPTGRTARLRFSDLFAQNTVPFGTDDNYRYGVTPTTPLLSEAEFMEQRREERRRYELEEAQRRELLRQEQEILQQANLRLNHGTAPRDSVRNWAAGVNQGNYWRQALDGGNRRSAVLTGAEPMPAYIRFDRATDPVLQSPPITPIDSETPVFQSGELEGGITVQSLVNLLSNENIFPPPTPSESTTSGMSSENLQGDENISGNISDPTSV